MSRFATVAVIAALAIGVTALAQENRKPRRQPNQPNRPVAAPAEKPAAAPTIRPARSVRGEIQALDIENNTVTLTTTKKGEQTKVVVETDASTEFTLDGAEATLVDLKPGMKVTVTPDTGIAKKIVAKSVKEQPKRNSEQPKRSNSSQAKRKAGNSGKQTGDAPKQTPSDNGTAGPAEPADDGKASPKSEQ